MPCALSVYRMFPWSSVLFFAVTLLVGGNSAADSDTDLLKHRYRRREIPSFLSSRPLRRDGKDTRHHRKKEPIAFIGDALDLDPTEGTSEALYSDIISRDARSKLDPALVAWVHIPKTGTSFANTLVSWACELSDADLVDDSYSDSTGAFVGGFMAAHSMDCAKGFRLHSGHTPIMDATLNNWAHHKGSFVGMFRQPEQRIISGYLDDQHGAYEVQGKLKLQEYAAGIAGCAAKMLAGHPCLADGNQVTQDMTALAISRLDDFAFIGITEDWALSVCLFHAKFGGKCHKREFSNVRPGMSRGHTYDISELHGWKDPHDGLLYETATAKFRGDLLRLNVNRETCRTQICTDAPEAFST